MPNDQDDFSAAADNTTQDVSRNEFNNNPRPVVPVERTEPLLSTPVASTEVEPSTSSIQTGTDTTVSQPQPVSAFAPVSAVQDPSPADSFNATPNPANTFPVIGSTIPESEGLNAAPKKSKKKFIIIGAIVAVLVLLIGLASAVYAFWYQNEDKVIGDALQNALVSKSAKTDTKLTFSSGGAGNKGTVDATFNTLNDQNDAKVDVSLKSNAESARFDASGSVMVKNNEKLYVKVNDLKELIEKSGMQMFLGSSPAMTRLIEKLDSNWVVVTKDELEENTGSEDKAGECVEAAIDKLRSDKNYSKELADLYKKYPLIGVKQKLGSKDGSLGYEIEFKRDNAVKFANGVNATKFYAELKKCDDKIEDLKGEDIFKDTDTDTKDKTKVVVWIDRWSHRFTKLEVSGSSESSKFSMTTNTAFDIPVKIEEPTKAITIDELQADIEAIQQEMMQAYEETDTGSASSRI